MAKVRLLGGKPLLVNGKVALTDECCCGEQPCTEGVCCYPDTTCATGITEEDCLLAGGHWLGCAYNSCDPNPCVDCNCAKNVSVTVTSTMTCDDGGGWSCGHLVKSTSYTRAFSAAEIEANFCLADDSVADCCQGTCCIDPLNQAETATSGAFVSFFCGDGFLRMTARVSMDCFICVSPCITCDDCVLGSPLSTSSFDTLNHDISLADATGTYTFDDHVSANGGRNCTADIHSVFIFP